MNLKQVEALLSEYNGNRSVIFPLIQERLVGYGDEVMTFGGNFLFFEERYLLAKKHMLQNGIHGDILDIGCQFGFQSEIFLDQKSYTGIDVYSYDFFNRDHPIVSYQVGSFPKQVSVELNGNIVFSIMSLGYFPDYVGLEKEAYLDLLEETLQGCDRLYIVTTEALTERLKKHFTNQELLLETVHQGSRFFKTQRYDLYCFSK